MAPTVMYRVYLRPASAILQIGRLMAAASAGAQFRLICDTQNNDRLLHLPPGKRVRPGLLRTRTLHRMADLGSNFPTPICNVGARQTHF